MAEPARGVDEAMEATPSLRADEVVRMLDNGEDLPTRRLKITNVTAGLASRLGRHLQENDSVEVDRMDVCALSQTENYDEFFSYLRTTNKLHKITSWNFAMQARNATVCRQFLEAVSGSSSISELTITRMHLPLACLLNLPSVKKLVAFRVTVTDFEAGTAVDFVSNEPSSSQLGSLELLGWDTNTAQLVLEITKIHTNTKKLVLQAPATTDGKFPLGSIVDTLRRAENITSLGCEDVAAGMSSFIGLLRTVPPSIRQVDWVFASSVRGQFTERSPTLERHISEALRAMKRSNTLVSVEARVRKNGTRNNNVTPIFSEQEQQVIHTIGLRNMHLPSIMCGSSVPSLPLGLWPHLIHCASRSGHRDHLQLIAGAIRILCQTRPLGKRTMITATKKMEEGDGHRGTATPGKRERDYDE